MNGLAKIIEEGIRYPGFAFINVQSPCVTYGHEDQMLKAQKTTMRPLESLGHNPADRRPPWTWRKLTVKKLYTGVFFAPGAGADIRTTRTGSPGVQRAS